MEHLGEVILSDQKSTNLDQEIRHLHPPVGRQLRCGGVVACILKSGRPRILFFLANGQPLNIGGGVKHV